MLTLTVIESLLGAASGVLVGLSLSLVDGGGSILAVPLLVPLVGVPLPHVAIGTSAVAVAANAAASLATHARAGHVRWPCAAVFAAAGVLGALGGARLGKMVDGQTLLAAFALMMVAVTVLMFRRREPAQSAGCVSAARTPLRSSAPGLAPARFRGSSGSAAGS